MFREVEFSLLSAGTPFFEPVFEVCSAMCFEMYFEFFFEICFAILGFERLKFPTSRGLA